MSIFGGRCRAAVAALLVCVAGEIPARADNFVGELRCEIGGGFGVVVSSFRNVTCVYSRTNGVIETYTGYTGFVDVGLGISPPRVATYDVVLTAPEDSVGLQGDYDTRLAVFGGPDHRPANALIGPAGVYLRPRSDERAAPSGVLNKVSGLERLHLIYAGVTYPSKRTAAGRR